MAKKQSKRLTFKKLYFIKKKVRDHNTKLRKKEREKQKKGIRRTLRDPGIPNNCPFKKELMDQLEHQREQEAKEKLLHKERLQKQRELEREEREGIAPKKPERPAKAPKKQKPKNSFILEIKKVIENSDVLLLVLDARDPLGSRCYAIEEFLRTEAPEKKIIFVLNKIDLIPKENFIDWLRYLTEIHPTVGFKCMFTSHIQSIGQTGQSSVAPLKKAASIGEDLLLDLLRKMQKELNKPISVGVIGYPNVGKSSLINSLKKCETVSVGAIPGFTKAAAEIRLEKDIKLFDSPGVIFAKKRDGVDCLLRNLVDIDQINNPVQILQDIFDRSPADRYLTNYRLSKFSTYSEFLKRMGEKKASYRKTSNAARGVLRDLVVYRFPFYFVPPKIETANYRLALQALQTHEPILKSHIDVNEDLYLPIESSSPDKRAESQITIETLKELFDQVNAQQTSMIKGTENDEMDDVEDGDDDEENDDDDEQEDGDENDEDQEEEEQDEKSSDTFNFATDFVADDDD